MRKYLVPKFVVFFSALLIASVALAFSLVLANQGAEAARVEVKIGQGAPVAMQADAAFERASREAGFDVLIPASFPANNLTLGFISVDKGPEGLPNAMPSVSVKWLSPTADSGGQVLEVLQFPVEIGAPDGATLADGTPQGVRAYVRRSASGTSSVTAFVGGRTFIVLSRGQPSFDESSLVRTASEFVAPD